MSNAVKHPSHYAEGRKYEPKDVIRDWKLNFNLGNAVKYLARAGRKDDIVQDLKKAQEYIQFEIDAIEEQRKNEPPMGHDFLNCKCIFPTEEEDLTQGFKVAPRNCGRSAKSFSHPIFSEVTEEEIGELIVLEVPAGTPPEGVIKMVMDKVWDNIFRKE